MSKRPKTPKCCGLVFVPGKLHDWLLTMEDDPQVLAEVFVAAAGYKSKAQPLFEIISFRDFVGLHEWRDRRAMLAIAYPLERPEEMSQRLHFLESAMVCTAATLEAIDKSAPKLLGRQRSR